MNDLEISQNAKILQIKEVAKSINIDEDSLYCFGKHIAKIDIDNLKNNNKNAKVILVTAISPTQAGEGKSTTTIGLGDALKLKDKNVSICLREPSFGPVLGIKGGACGGGYSQVIPMTDINLHFTGDIHAVTTANNAICAMLDNHIHQGNELNIDITKITINRVMDMNDRSLRNITIGQGQPKDGVERIDHFDISVASEIMALLCLCSDIEDFKYKVGKMVVAYNTNNEIVTVNDLGISGSIALIMKDAIKPNLVQSLAHTPVFIHGGPFANIAHGCNSVIATKTAMSLSDYVVTEAGFGADLGAEKFFNIKCRSANIKPSAVVLVATIRALKMHGGVNKEELNTENINALVKGIENLSRHIDNIKKFNIPYVVAINKFSSDTDNEINTLLNWATKNNHEISLSTVYEDGGNGAVDLANKVIKLCEKENNFNYLYELDSSLEDKIKNICINLYGASGVEFTDKVINQLEEYEKNGWGNLAVCMAKTPYSFSSNAKLLGAPSNFTIKIKELKPSIAAGFIVVKTGDIMTMPGLSKSPAALKMDINKKEIKGLF